MDDTVSKYLKAQQELHDKRSILEREKCSERSRILASKLSNVQNKHLQQNSVKKRIASRRPPISIRERTQSQCESSPPVTAVKSITQSESESDEEYIPSESESDESIKFETKFASRIKEKIGKVIDDGDKKLYLERIQQWKNLKTNVSKHAEDECMDVYGKFSADIQYMIENEDLKDHKIDNRLRIPNYVWNKLYRYQKTGVKWLWELHQSETGGILGDEMGLGKTVQIIAFFCALNHSRVGYWHGLGPSIIIAPATVIYQWVSHFHYWWPSIRTAVLHQSGSFTGSPQQLVRDINDSNGILLMTYAGIVKHKLAIASRKWHYVILDEGHKIRNSDTQISRAVKEIDTPYKLIVTGSPLQNNLQELWSLFDFISPGLLGTLQAFVDHFAVPITQGGYANATTLQEATGLAIATSLKNLIAPYILRRTKNDVQEHLNLPDKCEQVLFCSLAEEQKDLYRGYLLGPTVRSILDKECRYGDPVRARILIALTTLRKICNHPDLYIYECNEETNSPIDQNFGFWKKSGKMVVIDSLLKIWRDQGHRALVFTQSRAMLCFIEQYLQGQNYNYLKMDGSTSVGYRQVIIKKFNEDTKYLVFLATTRVGGLGVNLTGADRVVIYDPDWNPATDTQAKERAWRIGQKRNVTVYRLITAGTIEEKIYQRQIFKQLLSNKILVDPRQKNMIKTSTLQGLFTLEEPPGSDDTETVNVFKHTKVELNKNKDKKSDIPVNGSVIFTKEKLSKMRELAKNLSKNLSKTNDTHNINLTDGGIDPRAQYKKKREALFKLKDQVVEEPCNNLLDENVTGASFEKVITEIDIINKHVKKNPLDFLDKLKLGHCEPSCSDNQETADFINCNELGEYDKDQQCPVELKSNPKPDQGRDRKRKSIRSRKEAINREVDIKLKKKKVDKSLQASQDDYVLSKLFAKSGVTNALEHDKVLGLVEREERDRLKQEVEKTAKKALRALKKSRILR